MAPETILMLLVLIGTTIALGVSGVSGWRERRLHSIALLIGCLAVGAGTVWIVAEDASPWETQPVVDVSSVGSGLNFTLDVPHTRIVAMGDTYHFRPKVSDDELIDLLTSRFPDGTAKGYTFTVVFDGVRYHVDRQDDGSWIASRESVNVSEDNNFASIAFPDAALPEPRLVIGTPTPLTTDPAAVIDELLLLGATQDEDGSLVVPRYEGQVRLTFEGEHVTASWAWQAEAP